MFWVCYLYTVRDLNQRIGLHFRFSLLEIVLEVTRKGTRGACILGIVRPLSLCVYAAHHCAIWKVVLYVRTDWEHAALTCQMNF